MTFYLSNAQVRPVGHEVAEFIDTSEFDAPRRVRDDEPDGDAGAVTSPIAAPTES